MDLHTGWCEFEREGEPVGGYLAYPESGSQRLPGVVVIQEVWGVDNHIQDVTTRFALSGYVALAVSLYARERNAGALAPSRIEQAKRFLDSLPQSAWDPAQWEAELAKLPPAQAQECGETLGALFAPERPTDRYLSDLRAAVAYLRGQERCSGEVGSVGFCLGGGLSALLSCREPTLACAVIFYGVSPPAAELGGGSCPLLGLYGERDERINSGVPAFEEAANRVGRPLEVHLFAGAGHAFFNDSRPSFHPAAARSAWALTLSFLNRHTAPAEEVTIK